MTKFEGSGVCLLVTDGSKSWTSNYVNYITSNTVDDGWVRISVSFTAPSTDVYGITIFNSGCIGTFYADDVQVEEAEAPSSYNLLENGSMETSSYGWTMGSGASYYSGKGVASSTKSIRIVGNPTDQGTNAYQDVALNLPGTQTYVLSGWVNANAVQMTTRIPPATLLTEVRNAACVRSLLTLIIRPKPSMSRSILTFPIPCSSSA